MGENTHASNKHPTDTPYSCDTLIIEEKVFLEVKRLSDVIWEGNNLKLHSPAPTPVYISSKSAAIGSRSIQYILGALFASSAGRELVEICRNSQLRGRATPWSPPRWHELVTTVDAQRCSMKSQRALMLICNLCSTRCLDGEVSYSGCLHVIKASPNLTKRIPAVILQSRLPSNDTISSSMVNSFSGRRRYSVGFFDEVRDLERNI